MKSIKEKRGITLITLAVTIVVILILAGVTIDVTLGKNGILNKSKEAANRMNNLVKEDEAELNELLNELNETMDSNWNSNIQIPEENNEGGGNTEVEGENIGTLVDNGTIKVGDYVAYKPTGLQSYSVNGNYSGTGMDQSIQKENLNWRLLDKIQDGKVRLISEIPTLATVNFKGANSYNNIVYLLDDLCNTLYKGDKAISKNLKIEDIQNKMNLSVWNYNNFEDYGATYNTNQKQYPLIFSQEKGQTVNGSIGSLDLSEQNSIVTGTGTASNWSVKCTYWSKTLNSANYIAPIYFELFQNIERTYYLSSRCVDVYNSIASFYLRSVQNNKMVAAFFPVFSSEGTGGGRNLSASFRPVVILDFDVKINTKVTGKDGTKPETAWIIN